MKMNYHRTVWISFIKYHSSSDPSGFESQSDCDTQLRIWDGRWTPNNNRYIDTMAGKYSSTNFFYDFFFILITIIKNRKLTYFIIVNFHTGARNASLIEQICREEVPRLCSRSLVAKGSRPCSTQGMNE